MLINNCSFLKKYFKEWKSCKKPQISYKNIFDFFLKFVNDEICISLIIKLLKLKINIMKNLFLTCAMFLAFGSAVAIAQEIPRKSTTTSDTIGKQKSTKGTKKKSSTHQSGTTHDKQRTDGTNKTRTTDPATTNPARTNSGTTNPATTNPTTTTPRRDSIGGTSRP